MAENRDSPSKTESGRYTEIAWMDGKGDLPEKDCKMTRMKCVLINMLRQISGDCLPNSRTTGPRNRYECEGLCHVRVICNLSEHTLDHSDVTIEGTRYRSTDDERPECFGKAEA
jgi:hypothetical protein